MIGKYAFPLLAVIGLALSISTVIQGNQTPPVVPPVAQPAKAPFDSYVAGAGMVETSRLGSYSSVHEATEAIYAPLVQDCVLLSLSDWITECRQVSANYCFCRRRLPCIPDKKSQ